MYAGVTKAHDHHSGCFYDLRFSWGDYEECCLGLVRTDILEECVASIFRVAKINKLGTTLAVTNERNTNYMRREGIEGIQSGGGGFGVMSKYRRVLGMGEILNGKVY
jgi:hypothetical protein